VPLDGGVLTTTGPDGTTFELTIPGDALWAPETIAMTPVKLDAQPFGAGPTWGVELLPDGLTFNRPLKLVITPPVGQALPPVTQQLAFGWSGPNHEVALAATDPKDARLVLQLLHFSSYAYATATSGMSASLAGARSRIGGSAEARLQSAAADRLGRERQSQLTGTAESGLETDAELAALFAQYRQQVLQPRLAAAGTSCAAGRLAMQTLLGLERQAELLGAPPIPELSAVGDLGDTVNNVCLEEEWKLCRDNHIVQRLIPVVLGMERQAQLLGVDSTGKAWVARGADYVYKCHQYSLDVDTRGTSVGSAWNFSEPMHGVVKLKKKTIDELAPIVSQDPHGPLTSLAYNLTYLGMCTQLGTVTQHDAFFYVNDVLFTLKSDPTRPGKGEVDDLRMLFFPGQSGGPANPTLWGSTHMAINACSSAMTQTLVPNFNWWSVFTIVYGRDPQTFNTTDGYFFSGWTVYNDGGPVLARKVLNGSFTAASGLTHTAPTTLVLTHTPGG
jgi:hypothetical protein